MGVYGVLKVGPILAYCLTSCDVPLKGLIAQISSRLEHDTLPLSDNVEDKSFLRNADAPAMDGDTVNIGT
jgi:hypothetical protein